MGKAREAFRTISEVSDWLDTPAHVLRFWESKFAQVKPVKRAGGRRYYRPQDMALIGGIKKLLHEDGMTIKGVQKVLKEQGVRSVAALSPPLPEDAPAPPPPQDAADVSTPEITLTPPTTMDTAPLGKRPAGVLKALYTLNDLSDNTRKEAIAPLVQRLKTLRDKIDGETRRI